MTLQEARKSAKEAQKARSEERFCTHGYCEYPDILAMKFGGANKQNISWLNSQRHGENWLLASLPPVWKQNRVRLPLGVESVFGAVLDGLPELEKARTALVTFLEKASGAYTNIHIRKKRAALLEDMISVVVQWAARIREQEGAGQPARNVASLKKNASGLIPDGARLTPNGDSGVLTGSGWSLC